jgi:hypothetical protein
MPAGARRDWRRSGLAVFCIEGGEGVVNFNLRDETLQSLENFARPRRFNLSRSLATPNYGCSIVGAAREPPVPWNCLGFTGGPPTARVCAISSRS